VAAPQTTGPSAVATAKREPCGLICADELNPAHRGPHCPGEVTQVDQELVLAKHCNTPTIGREHKAARRPQGTARSSSTSTHRGSLRSSESEFRRISRQLVGVWRTHQIDILATVIMGTPTNTNSSRYYPNTSLAPSANHDSHWHRPDLNLRAAVTSTSANKTMFVAYEVGGQRLAGFRGVSRRALPAYAGFQPPLPEPDGHVSVRPALQYQVLRMKAESPIRATSTLVEPSTCPPSSCPGHYPRRWATTGTLSPWALLPVGDPVVVCLVRSMFRVSVRPLPLLIAGCVLSEDHAGSAQTPVRQESG